MEPNALLRTTYRINAAATLVCGAVLLIGGGALSPVFGAPTAALATVGGLFVVFAGWIWIISRRPQLFWNEAAAVGLLDATYAAASLAALAAFGTRMTLELKIAIAQQWIRRDPAGFSLSRSCPAGNPARRPSRPWWVAPDAAFYRALIFV
jgi:hypothetical protein